MKWQKYLSYFTAVSTCVDSDYFWASCCCFGSLAVEIDERYAVTASNFDTASKRRGHELGFSPGVLKDLGQWWMRQ